MGIVLHGSIELILWTEGRLHFLIRFVIVECS